MTEYVIPSIMNQIASMEKQIALLKMMMQTIAGTTIKSDASAVPPSKRTDTVAVSKRVNGYTLFLKEGGKRNQWKSVSKKKKEELAARAKKMNEKTCTPKEKKVVDAMFNSDLQIFVRPKGRPPKGMVWNDKTGKYQKDALPVKKCKHMMMRGANKGKACGKKCTGELGYCTAHLKHYVDSSGSESESSESESESSGSESESDDDMYDSDE